MTTATAPRVSREIIEARWHAAVTRPRTDVMPDGSRATGLDNSKAFWEWDKAVVDIATRLQGNGLTEDALEEVEQIAASIWDDTLRTRLLEWAEENAR